MQLSGAARISRPKSQRNAASDLTPSRPLPALVAPCPVSSCSKEAYAQSRLQVRIAASGRGAILQPSPLPTSGDNFEGVVGDRIYSAVKLIVHKVDRFRLHESQGLALVASFEAEC